MSFLDRLGKTVSGMWGAVEEPTYGLAVDMAGDIKADPSLGGFFHALVNDTMGRGADTLANIFGPEGAIGAPVGGLPDWARVPGRYTVRPVLDGDQWLYSHAISHPLATVLTVGSLSESKIWTGQHGHGMGDFGTLFDPQAWGDAWDMTNHTSPGQAFAKNMNFAFLPMFDGNRGKTDIMNDGEVNKFEGSDWYKASSGLVDALTRYDFDPLQLVAEYGTGLRIAAKGPLRGVDEGNAAERAALAQGASPEEAQIAGAQEAVRVRQAQIAQYLASGKWDRLSAVLDQMAERFPDVNQRAAAIKNRVFKEPITYDAAAALAQADGPVARQSVMEAMLGNNSVIREIAKNDAALAERLRMNIEPQALINDPTYLPEYHQSPMWRPDANPISDIDRTMGDLEANQRLQRITSQHEFLPAAQGPLGALKAIPQTSEFFQASPFTRPVRVFFNKVPTGVVNIGDPNWIDQVQYHLRQAGMDLEKQQEWAGRLANAPVDQRLELVQKAEKEAIDLVAKRHNIDPADMEGISRGAREYRNNAQKIVQDGGEDVGGGAFQKLTLPLDDQLEQVILPKPTNPTDIYPMTNFPALEKQFSTAHEFFDQYGRLPQQFINQSMRLWRAGVLLRPAWPVRIMGEHGLAMAAKAQDLALGSQTLLKGMTDYASWKSGLKNYWHDASEQLGLGWGGGTGALFGGVVAGPLGAVAGGAAGVGLQMLGRSLDEVPYMQFVQNGYLVHGAFGNPLDKDVIHENLISSRNDLDAAFGRKPNQSYRIVDKPDPTDLTHTTIMPGHPEHLNEMTRLLNEYVRDNPLAQVVLGHETYNPIYTPSGMDAGQFLNDYTPADAGRMWLENTPEGRAFAKQNPIHAADTTAWSGSMHDLVKQLTMDSPAIADKLTSGRPITTSDILARLDTKTLDSVEAKLREISAGDVRMREGFPGKLLSKRVMPYFPPERYPHDYTWEEEPPVLQKIPVNKIFTAQEHVDIGRVMDTLRGDTRDAPRVVNLNGGEMYDLLDGNHRVTAAKILGEKYIYARVNNPEIGEFNLDTGDFHDAGAELADLVREHRIHEPVDFSDVSLDANRVKDQLPTLHGEFVKQVTGNSARVGKINGIVEQAYAALGQLPLDDLINNQLFARAYYARMRQALAGIEPGLLTDGYLRNIENAARDHALNVTRNLMYDFANKSEFAQMVRTMMPFFPAWQQTIQRWAGLAMENPAFINRARMVLDAPHKMGITWKDPDTGEEYVRLRLPSLAEGIVNHGFLAKALDDQGYIRFQTKGLTLAGEGLPGFGPWVDIALRPFVKNHPDLQESLKFIYPYGVPDNAIQSFLPPNIQRAIATSDEDGRSFRAAYNRIIVTRLVKMQTGELPRLDLNNAEARSKFLADANEEAHQFMRLRLVAGAFAPAALQYDSPYQPLIDKYRALVKADPKTAQDKFLDQYGDDYFALTQAFTKLNNGIPATMQGEADYEKYRNLVQRFPELGSLIIGTQGGGSPTQFSAAVYQMQRQTPLRPGSDVMMRSPLSPEEIVQQSDARLGWTKFTRAMDLLDAELASSGAPNYNVKQATALRVMKDMLINGIANQHPQWYQEYSQRDEVKWNNRIAAMKVITQDPRLSQRPDIQMLGQYLGLRDYVVGALAARPAHGIDSEHNADLKAIWDTMIQSMKNGTNGLAFSDLYNRWLDTDPLNQPGPTTIGEAAA